MEYDYRAQKLVIVITDSLKAGSAANMTAHLSMSVAARLDKELYMGRQQLNASDTSFPGICRYPIIVLKAVDSIWPLYDSFLTCGIEPSIFFEEMLSTGHDDELQNALLKLSRRELKPLGLAAFGATSVVNSITGDLRLWR